MDASAAPADRLACTRCIGDDRLRADARAAGFDAECLYCGRAGTCVDVAWLADRVHPALQSAFEPAVPGTTPATLDGIAATASAAGLEAALARDVHDTLVTLFRDADGSPMYAPRGAYVERPARGLPALHRWDDFAEAAARAAPGADEALLDALKWVFARLDAVHTAKGRAALRVLDAGTRVFDVRLDGPSAGHGDAGPLNARDVPARCLAMRERTAVTERLVPRGSAIAVARLRLERPVRVLDLETARKTLARAGSFDHDRAAMRARARFLDGFAQALRSATVTASGGATWRPTQRVGDWLAHGTSPRVDGLLARAAHAPGRVLTLFAPACTTAVLVLERERRYVAGALRAKYRRLSPSGP